MEPSDVLLRFLESIGRPSETAFYLNLFRSAPQERFATIVLDHEVTTKALDAVVVDVRFLASLGLFPVMVHEGHPEEKTWSAPEAFQAELVKRGVASRCFSDAEARSNPSLLIHSLHNGQIPWIELGAHPSDLWTGLSQLLAVLHSRKVIFLRQQGGVRLADTALGLVNLSSDYESLLAHPALKAEDRVLIEKARELMEQPNFAAKHISVTSPINLLRELFTTKGAGTLLRKGAFIEKLIGLPQLDRARFLELIETSFGAPLRSEFFTAAAQATVYLEKDYRGVAFVLNTPLGGYLTKFAVEPQAQGEGLGRDLWQALCADQPKLFWRARPSNPITPWYQSMCDGFVRQNRWNVFWRGFEIAEVANAVHYALSQPDDIQHPES